MAVSNRLCGMLPFLRAASEVPLSKWRSIPKKGNQSHELQRLSEDPFIREGINKVRKLEYYDLSTAHLQAFGRSLEVFQVFYETHYVLNHGQWGTNFLVDYLLYQRLLSQESKATVFETFLRHPASFPAKCMKGKEVDFYKKKITSKEIQKHSDYTYRELLPADGYLFNEKPTESTLTAFSSKPSHFPDISRLLHRARESLAFSLFKDEKTRGIFLRKVHEIVPKDTEGGILFTACVPKDFFPHCGYLSRPFGVSLSFPEGDRKILSELQSGEVHLYPCGNIAPSKTNIVQVRLLTHKFSGIVPVFMFPTTQDSEVLDLAGRVDALVQSMGLFSLK